MIQKIRIDPAAGGDALAKLLKGEPNATVTLTPVEICVLTAHVQLALRHPGCEGREASQLAEQTIRKLIKKLPVAARPYLEAGFDPSLDAEP